jgi:hypothetical protein
MHRVGPNLGVPVSHGPALLLVQITQEVAFLGFESVVRRRQRGEFRHDRRIRDADTHRIQERVAKIRRCDHRTKGNDVVGMKTEAGQDQTTIDQAIPGLSMDVQSDGQFKPGSGWITTPLPTQWPPPTPSPSRPVSP